MHEAVQLPFAPCEKRTRRGSPSSCSVRRRASLVEMRQVMKIKISRGHPSGVCAPSVLMLAPLERVGEGFKGAITFFFFSFFSSIGPSWPRSAFACDPGKGIIRGRDGDQRPGEMNSGAPPCSHCGGMKGGKGLINVYRGSSPPSSPQSPLV